MKILIACEFSGIVRDAFAKRGHDAWSCDLLPTEKPGNHIQGDVLKILNDGWDLMIAHPPCTHLAVSGARWFKEKQEEQLEALEFICRLLDAPIPKIATENPIGIIPSRIRKYAGEHIALHVSDKRNRLKPDQIIQPHMFGHPETKATCLWLKNLPLLKPTNMVMPMFHSCHKEPPSPDRWKNRSRTFPGIAEAMATQWGNLECQ